METTSPLIHLSTGVINDISNGLDSIVNVMIHNSSPMLRNNPDIGKLVSLSEAIKQQLRNQNSLEFKHLFQLETTLSRLIDSDIIDNEMRDRIKSLNRHINRITDSFNIELFLDIDNVDPELIKFAVLKLKKQIERRPSQLIKESEVVKKSFSRELNTLSNEFKSTLASELNNMEQNSIKRMLEQSNKRLEELRKVQDGALHNFNDSVQDNIDSISDKISSEIEKFESRREDMDQLLEQVGLAKDAEVTISQANKEEKRADDFRKYGIGFLYASILVLVFMFSEYIGLNTLWGGTAKNLSDLTLEAFIIRFMTVTLISSPAIYMLKESASHRAKENLYRQRGTQLLTIRGYLSDLPDAQRTEVKKQLASNFFSFHNGKADTSNVPDFIKNMNEAIKLAHAIKTPQTSATDKKEQASS